MSEPKKYSPHDGLYQCPACKRNDTVVVAATCIVMVEVNDDGAVMDTRSAVPAFATDAAALCSNPKCEHKGKLRDFIMGYRDKSLDACPDCEHPMEIPESECEPDGTPKPDATVFCRECEGHVHKLADWKAKGWRCLENSVVFYKSARKSCPSCGQSVDFVDVTGKARDGYMLCRCNCTRWWAEPEDGHPSHSF